MTVAAPLLLLALLLLPLLWWLLRATPPSPRTQDFPAIRLLLGLSHHEEETARTPLWLLALRIAAAACLIAGFASPVLHRHAPHAQAATRGRILLAIDDGWASAHDWQRRIAAANGIAAEAARAHATVALLATAADDDGGRPAPTAFLPGDAIRARIAALHPHPWPTSRADAAASLADIAPGGITTRYVSDGLAAPGDAAWSAALARLGPVREYRDTTRPARLMLAPRIEPDALVARLASDTAAGTQADVLALDHRGDALARVATGPAHALGGGEVAEARIALPVELRNRLARLVVEGARTAGATRLLDESDRRRPIGLLSTGTGSDLPLIGPLYYLERALPASVELRRGDLATLLARPLSVIIAVDRTFADPAEHDRLDAWVRNGGTLIRFAGPRLAASDQQADTPDAPPDSLLPVALLPGARALGGAMSWTRPQRLAPFPPGSPFQGLAIPPDVTVGRQVLARPSLALAGATWAALADGTPVVTGRALGHGTVVLFHVTANADWSNLPLSGLFVQMLDRLGERAVGIATEGDRTLLAPVATMDAEGVLGPPGTVASGLQADRFGHTAADPHHPPGLYGGAGELRALDLSDATPIPRTAAPLGPVESLDRSSPDLDLGPWLLALGSLLLSLDLALSLSMRGLLRRRLAFRAIVLLAACAAPLPGTHPEALAVQPSTPPGAPLPATSPRAALETELAYVVTGNPETDRISRDGLAALSDDVNARTAAVLGPPAGIVPGRDDLAFYPLIYWPILPDAAPDPNRTTALDGYMRDGGVVLIDTQGGGSGGEESFSGAGFAPGAAAALRRVATGLDIPPLQHLSPSHVLAHSFYLLRDFPGRFAGAPVWVARGAEAANDGVSPVIIGANDWAAAWATGPDGQPEFAAIPGGEQQRATAMRFGVNLVMYALTGNYKADQVHVPALLRRMGQDQAPDALGPSVGELPP